LLGVFALFADREAEATGTLGASVQLVSGGEVAFRQDLLNGHHYRNSSSPEPLHLTFGDGTSVETVGTVTLLKEEVRVDVLTIDVPADTHAQTLRFKDLGSPASFVLFDVFVETQVAHGCPFHEKGGGIPLSEVGAAVRVGDRVKLLKALDQLENAICLAEDLDEARGQALTFLAMVTSATLEMGGSRAMHRVQLETARELDRLGSVAEIAERTRHRVEEVAANLLREDDGPSSYLVDRALAIVERNYAKDLTDASVAAQLGLSTSHFRFLFRQATGQPFHKYLIALRLEKARRMLVEQEMAVSAVAKAVGFAGLSHFSRAFAQRFSVSPTSVRRSVQ
jgi:AraC-like DNA-binding protein